MYLGIIQQPTRSTLQSAALWSPAPLKAVGSELRFLEGRNAARGTRGPGWGFSSAADDIKCNVYSSDGSEPDLRQAALSLLP